MRFKLNNSEIIAMIMLFAALVKKYNTIIEEANDTSRHIGLLFTYNHTNKESINPAEEMLYLAIFEEVHLQLQQKALLKKDKYNIKLSPTQALAFFIEFNDTLPPTTQAGNMVQGLCNKIHQQLISK